MKKIISLLVITTMIFSMVASLNIMSASADSTNKYEFKHYDEATSKIYTDHDGDKFRGVCFTPSKNAKYGKVTYHSEGIHGTDEPVLDIISDKYLWNFASQLKFDKPIVDISFQYYLPKGTEKNPRILTLNLAKKSSGGEYTNNNYGTYNFYFNSSSNTVTGTVEKDSAAKRDEVNICNNSIVPTDQWHDANLKIITETDSSGTKHLKVYMYVDGRKHIMCETTNKVAFDDVGINTIFFNTTDNNNNTNVHTYIKNLRVDYEDTDPTIYSTVLFDNKGSAGRLTINSTKNTVSANAVGESTTPPLKTSSASDSHFETNDSTPYKNVKYTGANGILEVELKPNDENSARHALIQDFKGDLSGYFSEGTTKYIEMSYDIMYPEGSESATKEQEWRFGNDKEALSSSIYIISSKLVGNKITIFNENTYDGDETTKKSFEFIAESGKWYRIIKLLTVTKTGSAYNIHADGYVKDLATDEIYKIYESDEVIPDGSGFVLAQQRTDIVTAPDANKAPVVTYYDNILARIWEDNFSDKYINRVKDMLPSDEKSKFDIELNCYDKINAVAKARKVEGITNEKLILAAYDSNNKLVGIKVSTASDIDVNDKQFVKVDLDITGKGAKKLKAFFFDDITTCKPLATAPELKVK